MFSGLSNSVEGIPSFALYKLLDIATDDRAELFRRFFECVELIHRASNFVYELLLRLSIFLDDHADVAARIEGILLLSDFGRAGELAQAGDVLVFRPRETLLQPMDVLEVKLGALHLLMQLLQ